ncbi:unnamed protein product, partial [Hapterophycus canaliculatus]
RFDIVITNDGHAVLSEIVIRDPLAVSVDGKSTIVCSGDFIVFEGGVNVTDALVVDAEITCNYTHVLTADNINDLETEAVVKVTAKDEHDYHVEASATEVVSFSQVGSIRVLLTKSYDKLGTDAAAATSDEVDFIYTITNNGLLNLYDIGIESDDLHVKGVSITCMDVDSETSPGVGHGAFTGLAEYPDQGLAPASSLTCTATDGVTQGEINAGVKTTSIQVQAWHESAAGILNAEVFSNSSGSVHLTPDPDCFIDIATEHIPADQKDGLAAVGETIVYDVESTNTGNVDVAWVTMVNTVQGSGDMSCSDGIPDPWVVDSLFVCTSIYSITQKDIDAGSTNNSVSLAGYPLSGGVLTETAIGSQVLLSRSNISTSAITKLVDLDGVRGASAGDIIEYAVEVSNTGTTTLMNIGLSDKILEGQLENGFSEASFVCDLLLAGVSLVPGRVISCSATYTVQQKDVNDGFVMSVLTVQGESNTGKVEDEASHFTVLEPVSSIEIATEAEVDPGEDRFLKAGDLIEYKLDVTNTGNTCLIDVSVGDGGMSVQCDVLYTAGSGDLEAMFCPQDDPFTCIGTHYIGQDDMDAGRYDTVSSVSSTSPNRTTITDTTDYSAELSRVANITIDMGVSYVPRKDEDDGLPEVGDFIMYTLNITNSGSVTLSSIYLLSPRLLAVSCVDDEGFGGASTLALDDSLKCSGHYIVTQSDLDSGFVITQATVYAESPVGAIETTERVGQDLLQEASVSIETRGIWQEGGEGEGIASPLDEVHFIYIVFNNGTVTLANLTVSDAVIDGAICSEPTLSPGHSFTCQDSTYLVDQEDIDGGEIVNRAIVTSLSPQGAPEGAATSSRTPLSRIFGIAIGKFDKASTFMGAADRANVDDKVAYSYDIHNNGTTTLSEIQIEDSMVPTSEAELSCDAS